MAGQNVLATFLKLAADPYSTVADWKKRSSKKVIGLFPMYLPEELVHASGMLPVVMWLGNEPVTIGNSYVPPFNCGLVRTFVDSMLKGKLEFVDGMIFYDTCLQARSLPFIVEKIKRPNYLEVIYHNAMMPESVRKVQRQYLLENLERMKQTLEEFRGSTISTELLKQSIEVYNKNRSLLRQLYELRRKNPGLISAKEIQAIVQTSMLIPKEEHNILMQDLLLELKRKKVTPENKVRLIAVGGLCQTIRTDILDLVQDMGAVIVDDDLYVGSKYFINDAKSGSNPLESLADRYLKRIPPCPTKGDLETNWGDYIIDMVHKNEAQGVLTFLIKYCPPHMAYYPEVKPKLVEANIPELLIEVEHEAVSMGQIRTKLQSLMELLGKYN